MAAMQPVACAGGSDRSLDPRPTASEVSAASAKAPEAGGSPAGGVAQPTVQPTWIAWQVPSRLVLAAAAPSKQRALLRDALQRTLEANGLRLAAKQVQELMCEPQVAVLEALTHGPAGEGPAASILAAHGVRVGARRRAAAAAGRI